MKTFARSLVLGIALLCTVGYAARPPETRPAVENQLFGTAQAPKTVDELDVPSGSAVVDFLKDVQHAEPDFQYVAEPGPWQQAPLPQMKLRNITLQQIVEMLTNVVPNLDVSTIGGVGIGGVGIGSGNSNPLYLFRTPRRQAQPQASTAMAAYGLAEPVERLGLKTAWDELPTNQSAPTAEQIASGRKKAMADVLSLLEAAVSQADPSSEPSLKVHPETQVLLLRGTPAQLDAVSQTLRALQSVEQINAYRMQYQHLANQYDNANRAVGRLSDELRKESQNNGFLQQRVSKLEKENAALKGQLQNGSGKTDTEPKH